MNRRKFLAATAATAAAPVGMSIASAAPGGADLTFSGALPLVPVSLGQGQPVLFVLDTGATVTLVDQSLSGVLGIDRFLPKSGASLRSFAAGLSVGGHTGFVTPAVGDLKPIAAALGQPVLGLLGNDFLSAFRVEIDFSARRLTLTPPQAAPDNRMTPMRFVALPYVRASVRHGAAELEGEFALDTGLDSGVKLRKSTGARAFPDVVLNPSAITTARGRTAQDVTTLDALRLGGLDIPNVSAVFSGDPPPQDAGPDYVGTIGAPALARRVLTLDYVNRLWRISPVML